MVEGFDGCVCGGLMLGEGVGFDLVRCGLCVWAGRFCFELMVLMLGSAVSRGCGNKFDQDGNPKLQSTEKWLSGSSVRKKQTRIYI